MKSSEEGQEPSRRRRPSNGALMATTTTLTTTSRHRIAVAVAATAIVVAVAWAPHVVVAAWSSSSSCEAWTCRGRRGPTRTTDAFKRFAAPPLAVTSQASTTTTTTADDSTTVAAADPDSNVAESSPHLSLVVEPIDPKKLVKLFGKLADKYLLLDPVGGGNCCFSGCTGCEYRLEGGGYRMADSTSSRPKWIPTYSTRINAAGDVVTSKWCQVLFGTANDEATTAEPIDTTPMTKARPVELEYDEFRSKIAELPYEPPLGGPSLPKSASDSVDDDDAIQRLWTLVTATKQNEKSSDDRPTTLTMRSMQRQLQRVAKAGADGGNSSDTAGLTWKQFLAALQPQPT